MGSVKKMFLEPHTNIMMGFHRGTSQEYYGISRFIFYSGTDENILPGRRRILWWDFIGVSVNNILEDHGVFLYGESQKEIVQIGTIHIETAARNSAYFHFKSEVKIRDRGAEIKVGKKGTR